MISFLITGGTAEERLKKAKKISSIQISSEIKLRLYPISNIDLMTLDSPTSIGIDEIRDLQKKLALKPFGSGPKVAIINQAQNLTVPAQNAFLKTLEEPPKNSQIILTAPTAESLLPTIISRCQIIELPQKPQISLSQKEFSQYLNILISFISSSVGERLKKIDQLDLAKDRQKAIEWVDNLTVTVRETLLTNLIPDPSLPAGRQVSPSSPSKPSPPTTPQLMAILRLLLQTKKYLQANVNIRLVLDNFLLDLPETKC